MRWWKRMPKLDEDKEEGLHNELRDEEKPKFKDYLAMILSAFLVFMPCAILVLLVLCLFIALFFIR